MAERMPALFIGHGTPMNALPLTPKWRQMKLLFTDLANTFPLESVEDLIYLGGALALEEVEAN
jgi:aromatic ring-opening dioxygenase catalytic subunit (LigB family)